MVARDALQLLEQGIPGGSGGDQAVGGVDGNAGGLT
jgi:hypothetical protein